MKKLLIISLLLNSTLILAQDYEARVSSIKKFKAKVIEMEAEFDSKLEEVQDYDSDKMINKDRAYLKQIEEKLLSSKEVIQANKVSLMLGGVESKIQALKDKEAQKRKYESAIEDMIKIENSLGQSKRLEAFIKATEEKKYNKAKIAMALLPKYEKEIAKQYDDANDFRIRNQGIQKNIDKEIKELKAQIEQKFSYPEKAMNNILSVAENKNKFDHDFEKLKKEHKQTQFDLKFSAWSCGLLDCEIDKGIEILRLVNQPETVLVKQDGTLRCAFNLTNELSQNSGYLEKEDFAYRCVKNSMFGCLDNERKKVCELNYKCRNKKEKMEASLQKELFFNNLKNKYLSSIESKIIQTSIIEKNPIFYDRDGKFNSPMSKDEITDIIKSVSQQIIQSDPKLLSVESTAKKIVDKSRKETLKKYSKRSDAFKRKLDYVHNSIATSYEADFFNNQDDLEEVTYRFCKSGETSIKEFCENYDEYLSASDFIIQTESLSHLNPGKECKASQKKEDGGYTQVENLIFRPNGSIHDQTKQSLENTEKESKTNVIEN